MCLNKWKIKSNDKTKNTTGGDTPKEPKESIAKFDGNAMRPIYVEKNECIVTNCNFTNNTATTGSGGAIYYYYEAKGNLIVVHNDNRDIIAYHIDTGKIYNIVNKVWGPVCLAGGLIFSRCREYNISKAFCAASTAYYSETFLCANNRQTKGVTAWTCRPSSMIL